MMELCVYITKRTDRHVAEMMGVRVRTVAAWRLLERVPRPIMALELIKKTEGVVDWESIYKPYALYHARKRVK